MTSRNLFFKLMKEDAKRRIWSIVLAVLTFFLFLTVMLALKINNTEWTNLNNQDVKYIISDMVGAKNLLILLITIVGAIICGISGFSYLHSKKKVDLYHSVPVERKKLFLVSYVNGLLIYLIPYIVNILLCIIILKFNGLLYEGVLASALTGIGINLVFYLHIYTLVIIAVMLTGNVIVSCLGSAIFLLYGPILMGIRALYFTEFFKTFTGDTSVSIIQKYLDPIGNFVDIIIKRNVGAYESRYTSLFTYILTYIILDCILILVAFLLYKKRPSEAAGRAMAFPVSKPIIKFLLVIPAAMLGGILFKQTAIYSTYGWFAFGLIFVFVITNALIEIIFNFDIRSAFKHSKQMLFSGIVLTGILCIFQFDLLKYDEYIPDENEIEYVGVFVSGLNSNLTYYEQDSNGDDFRYISNDTYHLERMKVTNFKAAYELAAKGIENVENAPRTNSGIRLFRLGYYTETVIGDYYTYTIKYTLKNGRSVYRKYYLTTEETYDILKDIFMDEEFKKVHYPINQFEGEDIAYISCNGLLSGFILNLSDKEKQQLLDIYREELMKLTLDDMVNNTPLGSIEFWVLNKNSEKPVRETSTRNFYNYVYPQFTKTIEFLKSHGYDVDELINAEDVKSINITNNNVISKEVYNEPASVTYTDKDKIKEILPNIVDSDYYRSNSTIIKGNDDLFVQLLLNEEDSSGNSYNRYFYFKDTIPDFVKDDVQNLE